MYNESKIIKDTANELHRYMSENFEDYEILFSNDGSKDTSAADVASLNLPNTRVVGYEVNRGKGRAIREGVMQAGGDIIMFTDADLAYGTDVIRRAYDYFEQTPGTHMLIGSRNLDKDGYAGYTTLRKLMSKLYIRILCFVGGFKLSDSQCGCKAFDGKAAKDIFSRCTVDGFAFDFEAILFAGKLGYKISEMPVKVINHRESTVRIFKDTVKMLSDLRRIKKKVKNA